MALLHQVAAGAVELAGVRLAKRGSGRYFLIGK